MVRLNVDIDHIATVRQARRTREPSLIAAATLIELAGADGIAMHLRSDRRPIQDCDVELLGQSVATHINLQIAPIEEMIDIACAIRPGQVTFAPEQPQEIAAKTGLDVILNRDPVREAIARLGDRGIFVSVFIEADSWQIEAAREVGARQVEINAIHYAELAEGGAPLATRGRVDIYNEIRRIGEAAGLAKQHGLQVAAGHGLNYRNVRRVAEIGEIEELTVGHSIVARACLVGLDRAVREMMAAIRGQITP